MFFYYRYKFLINGIAGVHKSENVLDKIIGTPKYITENINTNVQTTPIVPTTSNIKTQATNDSTNVRTTSTVPTTSKTTNIKTKPTTSTNVSKIESPEKTNNSAQVSQNAFEMTTEEIFEEENNLLSQVPDDLLNITVEKLTQDNEKQKLLKLWKQDLERYKTDKQIILSKNQSIMTEFKYLQSKKKEKEHAITENENELIPIDAALDEIEELIKTKDAEIQDFIKRHFPEQLKKNK